MQNFQVLLKMTSKLCTHIYYNISAQPSENPSQITMKIGKYTPADKSRVCSLDSVPSKNCEIP